MRHPVRPFLIEFKTRSSKPAVPRAPRAASAAVKTSAAKSSAPPAFPAFLDVSAFNSTRSGHGEDYESAMKAADAVFGRAPVSAPGSVNAADAPTGRVLPSLVETTAAPLRPVETPRPVPTAKKAKMTASPPALKPPRLKTPKLRPERVATREPATPAPTELAALAPSAVAGAATSAPDHKSRSSRKRRLLDAKLKVGERWKRRLCKAAR